MRLQFQFAGINTGRPGSSQRKRMRLGVLLGMFALAGLTYWHYIFHLTHSRNLMASRSAPAIAATAPAPAPVEENAERLPATLRNLADTGVAGIANFFAKPLPIVRQTYSPPATPVLAPETAAKPAAAKPAHRTPRVLTPEQKLTRAGQVAMNNMLAQANKYPDAYGFGPEDMFVQTTLGAPIPVYCVAEKDRAAYQPGQPVAPLLKPAPQWVFPVLAGDRICCMVQVSFNGRDYVPGRANKSLAMAWSKILQYWPAAEGYHPHLIVNPAIPGFFFTIPELPTPNLTDTDRMFNFQADISPADVILASWR